MSNDQINAEILNKIQQKDSNFNLIKFAVPIIDLLAPIKYSPRGEYNNEYFFICLLDFVITGVYWKHYRGTPGYPINGKYLNQIHNRYIKEGVYKAINKALLKKYLSTDREIKLKNQCIDSSFIANKKGSVKNNNHLLSHKEKNENRIIKENNKHLPKKERRRCKTFIDTNRYNGRKKYFKISSVTDSLGTPLITKPVSSKESDSLSLIKTIDELPIDLKTLNNSKINRYKQNLLADSGYCSKKNRSYLKRKGYTSLIKYNKRNTKNKKIINENKFNKKDKQIYKKRFVIEAYFSWIKNFPVINQNYQKTISSYEGLVSLASFIIISKRI